MNAVPPNRLGACWETLGLFCHPTVECPRSVLFTFVKSEHSSYVGLFLLIGELLNMFIQSLSCYSMFLVKE